MCAICLLTELGFAHFKTSSKSHCRALHTQTTVFYTSILPGALFKVSWLFSALRRLTLFEDPRNSVYYAVIKKHCVMPIADTEMRVLSDLATAFQRPAVMVFYSSYCAYISHAHATSIMSLCDTLSDHFQNVMSPDLGFVADNALLYACKTVHISSSS